MYVQIAIFTNQLFHIRLENIYVRAIEPARSKNFRTGLVLLIVLLKLRNPIQIVVSKTQNAVFRSLVVGDYQILHISHGILTFSDPVRFLPNEL